MLNLKYLSKLCILAALFQVTNSYAQENFVAGYIINQNRDSIHGYIDYRNWQVNPDKVSFKESGSNVVKIYSPASILEFGASDDKYISALVEVETSARETNKLTFDTQMYFRVDSAFLRVLYQGPKSLFVYIDKGRQESFYIQDNNSIQLLKYKKYLKNKDHGKFVASNLTYIGQLNVYLGNCLPGLLDETNTKYKTSSLIKLFKKYYNCSSEGTLYSTVPEKVKLEFGLGFGKAVTTFKYENTYNNTLDNQYKNTTSDYIGGVIIDVILPRSMKRWSLYNELLYSSYNISYDYTYQIGTAYYYNVTNYDIADSYLKMNNLLRYSHRTGKLVLYANAGVTNSFSFRGHYYEVSEFYNKFSSWIDEENIIDSEYFWSEFGVISGIGIRYYNFFLDLKYELSNSALSTHSNTRYMAMIGYQF